MRRAPFDNNAKRNVLNNTYNSFRVASEKTRDAEYRYSVNYSSTQGKNHFERSISADNVVIHSRGFKPSDRHDPAKRNFLENLTSKILHFDMETNERVPLNLQKLLTPPSDSPGLMQSKNRKMFASSYFYAPTHPTVEDQVELARRISHSLSDVKNMKSKGQSMYVNRKKRSVKWIHDGNGVEDVEEPSTPVNRDKVPLKCMMNPHGKVLDIHGIQALGEEVNIQPVPKNAEKLFDIVRDLNNQKGRGAEIFAKRRKRSEKWVVNRDEPQTPSVPRTTMYQKPEMNGGTKFLSLPQLSPTVHETNMENSFYNPLTVDLAFDDSHTRTTGRKQYRCNGRECNHSTEVKKIYLREVAVGTDNDFPLDKSRSSIIDKSQRITFEPDFDRRNNCRNNTNDNLSASINVNRQGRNCNKAALCKTNFSNMQYATNKEMKKYTDEQQRAMEYATIDHAEKFSCDRQTTDAENEYTPVPVKQLIQEFEKTCRPVLQYKQISPRVIPIVQQSCLENDLTRFFETRNGSKYSVEENHRRTAEQRRYQEPVNLQDHCDNGYLSTDEAEYTTEDTDSEMDDYSEEILYREQSKSSSIVNGDQEYSSVYREECSNRRRRSVTSEEVENFCNNKNGKFVNTESEIPPEAKSLLLSMIASEENILDTIKHLRNTPVLDNLLHGVSPDCKFTDICPDVGKKLYENNAYTGPKLSTIHNLTNYNTAPRGWDQSLSYYRPIKFEKPQEIVYSDF